MVNVRALVEGFPAFADGHDRGMHGFVLASSEDGFETLADGLNDGSGHGFAGLAGQLLGELVGFGVFDVETHESTILDFCLPVYHGFRFMLDVESREEKELSDR